MKKLSLLSLLILFLSCQWSGQDYVSHSDFALDTAISLKLYGTNQRAPLLRSMEEIERLEAILSVHQEGSDPFELNRMAGKSWVEISPETLEILQAAKDYHGKTQGYLDITADPLIQLWAIDPPKGYIPNRQEINFALGNIGIEHLKMESNRAYLSREAMAINLGALAKGYIADQVKAQLLNEGFESGIINLGGNILLIGSKPGGLPFRIGIQDPRSDRGEDLGILSVVDKSLVTSGDYERFFLDDEGNRYHHILDPYTGYPSYNGLIQVTILSPESLQGDALSTGLFLMGMEESMKLMNEMKDIEAIFVTEQKEIFVSTSLESSFEFTAQDRGYQLTFF